MATPAVRIVPKTKETNEYDWLTQEADDFPGYRQLCHTFGRHLLTKSELTIISHCVAHSQNLEQMGRPHIRKKSGVMWWIQENWPMVEEAIRNRQVHLPARRWPKPLRAATLRQLKRYRTARLVTLLPVREPKELDDLAFDLESDSMLDDWPGIEDIPEK
jgi:hypothetical protein